MSNIITKKFICRKCKKEIIIDGTEDQWTMYKQGQMAIQRIFPEVPPDNREILQAGQCGECFDKMFANMGNK
jgi:hypothetical protein